MATATTETLRERKKRRTQRALQAAAIRLMDAHGFADTTIDEIAAAAEVSPRTFFRYFPTKEAVLLTDLQDADVARYLADAPATLSITEAYEEALRASFSELPDDEWEVEQARMRLVVGSPELGMSASLAAALRPLSDATEFIRHRLGLPADNPRPSIYAAMMVAAVGAAAAPLLSTLDSRSLDRKALLAAVHRGLEVLTSDFPTGRR